MRFYAQDNTIENNSCGSGKCSTTSPGYEPGKNLLLHPAVNDHSNTKASFLSS